MDVRLATQVLVLQLAVVTLTLGIAGGLLAYLSHARLAAQYETQSLDTARAIAFAPAVRANVARYENVALTPSPAVIDELANGLQKLATGSAAHRRAVRGVITNNAGIRLTHPNRNELAQHVVKHRPVRGAGGAEQVMRRSGTLGPSVRAKVPVLAPDSGSGHR